MEAQLEIRDALERARASTQQLLEPIADDELVAQASVLTSPIVWEYAHVAAFEELWLLRSLNGTPSVSERHREVEEALRHEHDHPALPPLRPAAVRSYAEDVRTRVLGALEHLDLDAPNALLRHRFVFGLVIQNELQHQEAMLQTVQLRTGTEYPVPKPTTPDAAPGGPVEIHVPAGSFVLGAVYEPWAYDNELESHEIELRSFWIDRAPVTNRDFAEFVEDRGYHAKRVWSPEGWDWREREGVSLPLYWEEDDEWQRVRFGRREPLPPDEPVQHV
ncbi:MAG TPA: SUMF1/EgtB/PvdO family nonheme iron enzyme, partial [Gaiellaceae bacterium]|nr:SUMF1/EgtB/PvdO family nonheme iron enzyme [Gaiellaceae bacterium]